MSAAELEALLLGLLRLWHVQASATVVQDAHALVARIDRPEGQAVLELQAELQPFGWVWRVQPLEALERARTHPSINGAIRHLRSLLAPERDSARVLFAPGASREGGG